MNTTSTNKAILLLTLNVGARYMTIFRDVLSSKEEEGEVALSILYSCVYMYMRH